MIKKIILLFSLFLSLNTFAQNTAEVKVDLSNPNATIYSHLYFLQSDSYQPEKAGLTLQGVTGKEAEEKAIKLKRILDGKGLFVDFNRVPTNPEYNDTIGYVKQYKYVLFPDRMPLVSVEKVGEKWQYSLETVRNIENLYAEVFPWYVQKLHDWIPDTGHKQFLGIQLWQVILLVVLLLVAYLLYVICKRIIYFCLQKAQYRITQTENDVVKTVLKQLAHPLSLLLGIAYLEKAFPALEFGLSVNHWVFLGLDIAATIFWVYVFLKLVQVVMRIYAEFTERTHGKLDDQLVPILHKFLTGLVIFFGILKLLTLFGVDPTTVIAGASIGGLAVALASQDTVKNLIGTFMIFLDKPFHIGDWIEADSLSGEVEEVGFRSTRVRAADTSVYQIPNSKLSEITINNKGLRKYRRYTTTLGLRYDTPPELIEAFVAGVRKIVEVHPATRTESYNVEFTGFGDSALLIMVNVYFKSLAWGIEQSSKHLLHMAILNFANDLGVQFAFPSSTVMVEQFPDKNSVDLKYNTNQETIDIAIQKAVNNFPKE